MLTIDAQVSLGYLRIALVGLSAALPLTEPYTPRPALDGLEISYAGGGLVVAGALAQAPHSDPAEWLGALGVQYGSFGASAIGSYTTVNGRPSLFAFVWVDYPLGGPPVFFVTGLAGGFGFNRTLALPTIDGVANFPLVAGAAGGDQRSTQTSLQALTSPAEGQNWIAAGLHFTSLGMVDSRVLATMSFGTHPEFALMGRSTLTVPAPLPGVTTVAQATIVLLARFDPGVGLLAVDAQLAPPSYVLSPDAMLSGGAAFYLWFAPSEHAGDFVLTLGGYHPLFASDHYPVVPRLALSWQIDGLTLKGGLYFALTPALVMLGGSFEASWSSGELSAWFTLQADFLARFHPFSYSAELRVSVGASYTLSVWKIRKRFTAHASVRVSLVGPPFSGRALVDLGVISFTISFGARGPAPPGPRLARVPQRLPAHAQQCGRHACDGRVARLQRPRLRDRQHDHDRRLGRPARRERRRLDRRPRAPAARDRLPDPVDQRDLCRAGDRTGLDHEHRDRPAADHLRHDHHRDHDRARRRDGQPGLGRRASDRQRPRSAVAQHATRPDR